MNLKRTLWIAVTFVLASVSVTQSATARVEEKTPWRPLRVPGFWEKQYGGVIDKHDGFAWYRCFVKIPADWRGQELNLTLGRIDDCDESFVNGVKIGAMGGQKPYATASDKLRAYAIAPKVIRFGDWNLISIRVFDGGGGGGIWRGPVRLVCQRGTLSLEGNWQFRTGDHASWAKWPFKAGGDQAEKLAAEFVAGAGKGFGKPVDYSPLPGTRALNLTGDIASYLVEGVDRFLLTRIDKSPTKRAAHWKRDVSSPAAYDKSIRPNRERLAHILGVRDKRVPFDGLELIGTTARPSMVGRTKTYEIHAIRWPAFGDVEGEGLLLTPTNGKPVADIVAIPDSGQTPEQIAGLVKGVGPQQQYARRLAESGCRVVVPVVINRKERMSRLTNREFLYRSAFELGRHLIGYEIQKVLACVDFFNKDAEGDAKVGVIGWGEGGLLALYTAALDTRIDAAYVSGYFDNRSGIWTEPIDRNIFGLLEQFGDSELASMIAPRALIIEAAGGPEATIPGGRGAPARVVTPRVDNVREEFARARKLVAELKPAAPMKLIVSGDGSGPPCTPEAIGAFLSSLSGRAKLAQGGDPPKYLLAKFDPDRRHLRQVHQLDRHNQHLLRESSYVRKEFMKKLDRSSLTGFERSARWYRKFFRDDVIGRFDRQLLSPDARTRKTYDEEKWTGYEVVLDVYPDVIAYGLLLLPKDLKPGEKRPVVICQHGLEGRPQHTIGKTGYGSYKAFTAKLAERGFITFAPQNLYIFGDRFRTLQRKANPLKKTLFSIIVPQHQQITDWLKTLPFVDAKRIAFYGLSYGGKTAMRVPPLVSNYCLSICSADFNDWVWKNASTRSRYSYVRTGEYEIFEFDLGGTFNYAEMASLIAPRPFMVERGHFDGVAPDETVAYEFAKVRRLYQAELKIPDRCEIEWFAGPHTINEDGAFKFLHKHLNWPRPKTDTRTQRIRKLAPPAAEARLADFVSTSGRPKH